MIPYVASRQQWNHSGLTLLEVTESDTKRPPSLSQTSHGSRDCSFIPECDDDGGGLGTGGDECDDEKEDEEGDEGAAGAVALPRHRVAVLVQVGLDDDKLQLVATLTAGRRRDDLSALDAGAVRVVTDLWGSYTSTFDPCMSQS